MTGPEISRRALRTPRSAAVAGIAFSVLLTLALVIVRLEVPRSPGEAGQWLSDSSRRKLVLFALSLVPFAGIAFLWFIGVVRDRVGALEDRFFATVFLGSGLLFTAMLFAATAVATALVATAGTKPSVLVASGVWSLGRHLASAFLDIALRMAAVFTIAGSTILRRTGTGPPWLTVTGYLIGVGTLLAINIDAWLGLLFPLWVFALSIHILVVGFRRATPPESPGDSRRLRRGPKADRIALTAKADGVAVTANADWVALA